MTLARLGCKPPTPSDLDALLWAAFAALGGAALLQFLL
jgi:hypothetical protein